MGSEGGQQQRAAAAATAAGNGSRERVGEGGRGERERQARQAAQGLSTTVDGLRVRVCWGAASVSQTAPSRNRQACEQHRAHCRRGAEGAAQTQAGTLSGDMEREHGGGERVRCGYDDQSSLGWGAHPSPRIEADSKRHALPEAFLSASLRLPMAMASDRCTRLPPAVKRELPVPSPVASERQRCHCARELRCPGPKTLSARPGGEQQAWPAGGRRVVKRR